LIKKDTFVHVLSYHIELDDVEPQEEPEDLIKEESADSKEPPPSSPSPPSKLPEQVQTFLKVRREHYYFVTCICLAHIVFIM
jgi:fatty acid-binding protein DegV